ncbi:hypothetical protein B0H14DRAFT_3677850 [Mycena olivaceomarginata]|nr:hypothetical protein B0H14DRAFT_3677850 [Mycena olivaceomarginata]
MLSSFLDNVTTDIIHYEEKGMAARYLVVEAKSYYTLAATSVKFFIPAAGLVDGCPERPSLYNVSCALSLSSRVGVIGPNGAGKSTLIKLLTKGLFTSTLLSESATFPSTLRITSWHFQDDHELLGKATRVLIAEEKVVLDQEWVGKDSWIKTQT